MLMYNLFPIVAKQIPMRAVFNEYFINSSEGYIEIIKIFKYIQICQNILDKLSNHPSAKNVITIYF